MIKQSKLFLALGVFVLTALGGCIYLGMSHYMLTQYQITVKASNLIGIICASIYYLIMILAMVMSKAIPNLYEKHGALDDEDEKQK